MLRTNLPRALRHLRRHRGWRQLDLAGRTGVSRQVISRIERGEIGPVQLRTFTRLAEAFEATVEMTVRWQGEQLDRLTDAAHAHVVESAAALLRADGWTTRAEVSFNHYGDRGRVDLLAFHPVARIVVVVEAKSAIGDTQDTIGRLDVKARLGSMLAEGEG
jgi:transcriptional regulator with XRE-family HTH domain